MSLVCNKHTHQSVHINSDGIIHKHLLAVWLDFVPASASTHINPELYYSQNLRLLPTLILYLRAQKHTHQSRTALFTKPPLAANFDFVPARTEAYTLIQKCIIHKASACCQL